MITKIQKIFLSLYPAYHKGVVLLSTVYLCVLAVGWDLSSVPFLAGVLAASTKVG